MASFASAEGTERYAERFAERAAEGHFRQPEPLGGLVLSSIGIGTYLGEHTAAADQAYTDAVVAAVTAGVNVMDTAINYRFQRSERAIGAALERLRAAGYDRSELLLCTKAGFLTPDGDPPADPNEYFHREYLKPGIFTVDDVVGGMHCMTPRYLEDQLGRSLRNLGVECIDVFYLHNPETQLGAVLRATFARRVRAAFEFLEAQAAAGKIRFYGMATWNGFRLPPEAPEYLSLAEVAAAAREIGGERHGFRFVQLPYNLAMPEALLAPNQKVDGEMVPMVEAARRLGIVLVASASLMQGQLARGLPGFVAEALGQESDRHRAIQFVRSTPGFATALVGMGRAEHAAENLKLVAVPPASRDQFLKLFERRE
jgi:aryl-alcohol dehydrogenase-like predicted oxidoreductase